MFLIGSRNTIYMGGPCYRLPLKIKSFLEVIEEEIAFV